MKEKVRNPHRQYPMFFVPSIPYCLHILQKIRDVDKIMFTCMFHKTKEERKKERKKERRKERKKERKKERTNEINK